jgi:serralysin
MGGNDIVTGSAGDDVIYAGSVDNPIGGYTTIGGDGGNDSIIGGSGVDGFNYLSGTNDTLLGIGEHDTLIGGNGGFNYFYLGGDQSYYVGDGDADYATISNFNPDIDAIQLAGSPADYEIEFANSLNSVYKITNIGRDLIGKITYSSALDINSPYFNFLNN